MINIHKEFNNNGYELIKDCKNTTKDCLCICLSCKNKKTISLHSLRKLKIKCRNCYNLEIKKYFEQQGCILLSQPSRSNKMNYICKCGTEHSVDWFNFKNGTRCRNCLYKKSSQNNLKKQKVKAEIKNYFKKQNCTLLDNEYNGQLEYLNFICSCGTKDKVRWKEFRKGSRCKNCIKEKIKNRHVPSGKNHFRWNPDREEIKLRKTIRSRIKKSLKKTLKESNKQKIKNTFEHLGYSKEELINYITNHPNWNKVKNLEWELDHIIPIKAFFDHKIYDEKIINSLINLQPLTKDQNRSKLDNYNEKDFLNFIKKTRFKSI
jgi:hypothetical protein